MRTMQEAFDATYANLNKESNRHITVMDNRIEAIMIAIGTDIDRAVADGEFKCTSTVAMDGQTLSSNAMAIIVKNRLIDKGYTAEITGSKWRPMGKDFTSNYVEFIKYITFRIVWGG